MMFAKGGVLRVSGEWSSARSRGGFNQAGGLKMIYPVNALSDADLERRVRNYLAAHGIGDNEGLEVEVNQGVVTLNGRVPSESARWLAVSCGRRVAGVVTLVDQLHVIPRPKIAHRQVAANYPSWMLDYQRNASLPQETGYEYDDPNHEPSAARRRL